MASCQLYLITPPAFEPVALAETLARTFEAGPVACVQLRLKQADDDRIRRAADCLRPVCHSAGVPLIMNDRPDLAFATGCDGVHVGQDDAPYAEARHLLGPDAMIGVTCKASRHLAMVAAEQGADYVAFGAFYPSATKEATVPASPGILEWWSDLSTVPSVAIGGITPANCGPLRTAGADFLAVVGAVWNHPDGAPAGVRAFTAILSEEQQ